ncbi:potassium channel family protein [Soonwooa sp.]|uniref:potassium channel family protein n=1 Tax=Soonwooa sp. TaxID=1938592 RepID=UPI002608A3B2|nr:potassium channel family protein [Soonwooa sp.]
MFKIVLVGILVVACNVIVQALSTLYFLRIFIPQYKRWRKKSDLISSFVMLVFLMMFFTLLHGGQCTLWAAVYYLNPHISSLASFSESIYFSLITFTTIGYGDVVIDSEWRILAGLEAINGIMLVGWSTAMVFSFLQVIYKNGNIPALHPENDKH